MAWKKSKNAKPIISITVEENLLESIDDFRFEQRYANRSQAINHLIELGFKHLEEQESAREIQSVLADIEQMKTRVEALLKTKK